MKYWKSDAISLDTNIVQILKIQLVTDYYC